MKTGRMLLGILLLVAVGCARNSQAATPAGTPSEVVEHVITAWEAGDSQAIEKLLSQQGLSNADTYCNGAAIQCLHHNYQGNGELQTYQTEVVEETAERATIRLRTTWSDAGERCQTYELEKTEVGWRVAFFGRTRKCPEG